MKNIRNFKGVWIPKEIWLSKNLSLQEKVFLVEIDSLDQGDRGCYAGNEYFSKFFGLSLNRCSSIISSLHKKNFISLYVNKESGKSIRTIVSLARIPTTRKRGVGIPENSECPLPENSVPNNTEENNTIISSAPDGARQGELIDLFKNVNPNYKILFQRKNQHEAIVRMVKEHGFEKLSAIISFLPKNNSTPYASKVTTPIQLEENMGKMMAFWQQEKQRANKNKVVSAL
jgi:hypothetical protein